MRGRREYKWLEIRICGEVRPMHNANFIRKYGTISQRRAGASIRRILWTSGVTVSGTLDFEARSTAIIGQLQGKISTVVRESVIST